MERAPAITLTAVGTGREVRLDAPGQRLLLICFAQDTQAGIEAIEEAVRERFPDADDVLVGHIVDLRKIPGLLRASPRAS